MAERELNKFAWLILVDSLNTKNMLQRRNLHIQDDPICVMCDSKEKETIEHLFFECQFAKECWATINFVWDLSLPLLDRYTQARETHSSLSSLIAAWELWKARNDKVFQRRDPNPSV